MTDRKYQHAEEAALETAPQSNPLDNDPLAELARLVSEENPFAERASTPPVQPPFVGLPDPVEPEPQAVYADYREPLAPESQSPLPDPTVNAAYEPEAYNPAPVYSEQAPFAEPQIEVPNGGDSAPDDIPAYDTYGQPPEPQPSTWADPLPPATSYSEDAQNLQTAPYPSDPQTTALGNPPFVADAYPRTHETVPAEPSFDLSIDEGPSAQEDSLYAPTDAYQPTVEPPVSPETGAYAPSYAPETPDQEPAGRLAYPEEDAAPEDRLDRVLDDLRADFSTTVAEPYGEPETQGDRLVAEPELIEEPAQPPVYQTPVAVEPAFEAMPEEAVQNTRDTSPDFMPPRDLSREDPIRGHAAPGLAEPHVNENEIDSRDAVDPFAALEGALQREVDSVLQRAEPGIDDVDAGHIQDTDTKSGIAQRGKMIAAGVLGLVVLGAVGAFAYNGLTGGSGSDGPRVIAAADEPLKIRPENPGGEVIPHQNSMILDRSAGGSTGDEDTRLVPREEAVAALPAPVAPPKTDDRVVGTAVQPRIVQPRAIEPNQDPNAPRRVRTMIVRPDGTIVRADDPASAAPAPIAPAPAAPETAAAPNVPVVPLTPANSAAQASPEAPVAPAPVTQTQPPGATAASASVEPAVTDAPAVVAAVPLPTPRPGSAPSAPAASAPAAATTQSVATQPVTQSAAPAATAAAPVQTASAGGYVVQLASRRTQEQALAAFASYQSQYPSILGSYSPLIERADLGDRGVFFRLRVGPLGTQTAANDLCNQLKGAGLPDCFVRRN